MYTDYTTLDLSFLKNTGKESYDVIRSFGKMMAENQGRVRTWNIEHASYTPARMYWTACFAVGLFLLPLISVGFTSPNMIRSRSS